MFVEILPNVTGSIAAISIENAQNEDSKRINCISLRR